MLGKELLASNVASGCTRLNLYDPRPSSGAHHFLDDDLWPDESDPLLFAVETTNILATNRVEVHRIFYLQSCL